MVAGVLLFAATAICLPVGAQTFAQRPTDNATAAQLQALSKKLDEQNAKIDMLSQQILKLEQQLANSRPGVMIGEATPAPTVETNHSGGNTHIVARGETLTSIAKMHNVTISELQKLNHIENDRKLQIGQTILLPVPGSSASPSPSE